MGRGETQNLIRQILLSLSKGSKSITDISDETKLDRNAIGKYLNLLKEGGLLMEEQKGTSKVFTLKSNYRTDTYFGLPLSKEAEYDSNSLFYLIKKNWEEQTTKELFKTHAQKIAYKVIQVCDKLKIPNGWYIYGGVEIVVYNSSTNYSYYGLPLEVENCIKEVTLEYAKFGKAWEVKKQQYFEAGKELYNLKEELLRILYSSEFSSHPKNSLFIFVKKLRKLIEIAPKTTRKEYVQIMDSYSDLMFDISNKLEENTISETKREIITLFEAIWKYMALFNLKNDLFESNFYSKEILDQYFLLDIIQQEEEILELGTELQSLIPEDETDEFKLKLHKSLDKAEKINTLDLEIQNKELKQIKKNNSLDKHNKELLRRSGLIK